MALLIVGVADRNALEPKFEGCWIVAFSPTINAYYVLGFPPETHFHLSALGNDQTLADIYERFPQLSERRSQRASTLSGGERQMLALGRALMAKPRLLMLDEPSLGLAPLIIREVFRIISSLRELGVSILLVEQNARAALETADRGYVLENGEIVLSGPSLDLMHDPRVVASYLGGSA